MSDLPLLSLLLLTYPLGALLVWLMPRACAARWVAMAVNAGVRAIGVNWGYHCAEELIEAGAEVVARDPAHLKELLG